MKVLNKKSGSEDGNVLFLILIAVALFAALSYAVTQSSRSGGSSDDSSSLVKGSQITQYPASVKTAVLRMQVSKGVPSERLAFNPPSFFGGSYLAGDKSYAVFHPEGGGATYQGRISLGSGSQIGPWRFIDTQVEKLGTSTQEIIAILPNVPQSVCAKTNEQLGLKDPGTASSPEGDLQLGSDVSPLDDDIMDENADGVIQPGERVDLGEPLGSSTIGGSTPELEGEAFGCLVNGSANSFGSTPFAYYHVIVER